LLPVGGFALAIFAGWVVPVRTLIAELGLSSTGGTLLSAILRYAVPLGIAGAGLAPWLG
jgi:hypothetical protein